MEDQSTFAFDAFVLLSRDLKFHDEYHRGGSLASLFPSEMPEMTPKARFVAKGLYYMAGNGSGLDRRSIITMLYVDNMIDNDMQIARDADYLDGTDLNAYDCYDLPEGVKVIKVTGEDLNDDCEELVMSDEVPEEWADKDNEHFKELVVRCVIRCALEKMAALRIDHGFIV